MKLIVEGYPYKAQDVEKVLQGIDAPQNKDGLVRVNYVGYFYNKRLNDCIFFLPKVVIDENHKLLWNYTPEELIDVEKCSRLKTNDRNFIYGLSVWIYRAVREFQRLHAKSEIVYVNTFSRIDGSKNQVQNTLLDVILSLIRFNKENHNFFMFTIKNIHSGYNKINWTKTISHKSVHLQKNNPVYVDVVNKKKRINFDEELLIIFYSILNHIREKYGFRTNVDGHYQLITGNAFKHWMKGYGKIRLRQIKYKYFEDKALALWKHCYAFFELTDLINSSRQQSDYMLVKNFNIVFEAMIDELLSDKNLKVSDLADQPDGKRVDHIYAYDGLISNEERIYYIGDSKYYKIGEPIGDYSVYKQYTYARNVIQYNLKLFLNGTGEVGKDYLIYRDPETEGYNITPNFFISARLNKDYNYDDNELTLVGDEEPVKHFENRLFDRDTLLLQHYDVNFLFVVALYAGSNEYAKSEFKSFAQEKFRKEIIKYLSPKYTFYSLKVRPGNNESMKRLLGYYFRDVIGKTFRPYKDNDVLYLACDNLPKYEEDNLSLLSMLSQDFDIREYRLGTDPRSSIAKYVNIAKSFRKIARNENEGRVFRFEDFSDEIVLFGGYRADKESQLSWILNNRRYNVRVKLARHGSIGRIKAVAISARILVLYNIEDPVNTKQKVFLIGAHQFVTEQTMINMGYEKPDGKYLLYDLLMELPFEQVDMNRLLDYSRLIELENRRRDNKIKEGWEEEWKGTPLYYKASECTQFAKEYPKSRVDDIDLAKNNNIENIEVVDDKHEEDQYVVNDDLIINESNYIVKNQNNKCYIFLDNNEKVFSSSGNIKEIEGVYYRFYYTYSTFTVNVINKFGYNSFVLGKRIVNAGYRSELYKTLKFDYLKQITNIKYSLTEDEFFIKVDDYWYGYDGFKNKVSGGVFVNKENLENIRRKRDEREKLALSRNHNKKDHVVVGCKVKLYPSQIKGTIIKIKCDKFGERILVVRPEIGPDVETLDNSYFYEVLKESSREQRGENTITEQRTNNKKASIDNWIKWLPTGEIGKVVNKKAVGSGLTKIVIVKTDGTEKEFYDNPKAYVIIM